MPAMPDPAAAGDPARGARLSRRRRGRVAICLAVCVVLLVIDQLTKFLARQNLSTEKDVPILGPVLSLRLLYNPGATLGMGSSATWVISVFAIVVSCALLWAMVRTDSLSWGIVCSLAFSGAVGNLIDRIVYAHGFLDGRVVDFLDYGWSIGNIADAYLTIAAVIAIVLLLRSVPFAAGAAEEGKAPKSETGEGRK